MQGLLRFLFLSAALVVLGALTVAIVHRARVRSSLGGVIVAYDDRRRRRLMLFAYLALTFLGCQRLGEFGRDTFFVAAIVSVVGAVALMLLPTAGGGWIGTAGVRLGWLVRPWSSIESWRLIGEHFRFLVDDRWRAIPVTEAESRALRTALEATIPAAESERT